MQAFPSSLLDPALDFNHVLITRLFERVSVFLSPLCLPFSTAYLFGLSLKPSIISWPSCQSAYKSKSGRFCVMGNVLGAIYGLSAPSLGAALILTLGYLSRRLPPHSLLSLDTKPLPWSGQSILTLHSLSIYLAPVFLHLPRTLRRRCDFAVLSISNSETHSAPILLVTYLSLVPRFCCLCLAS